mmetsp:Transcript_3476/g.14344  ORF Transcript_3476/g.14344 Transcript_3476/m.14344 type:complete len:309 (-) Transcript_3476:593-1519(-)
MAAAASRPRQRRLFSLKGPRPRPCLARSDQGPGRAARLTPLALSRKCTRPQQKWCAAMRSCTQMWGPSTLGALARRTEHQPGKPRGRRWRRSCPTSSGPQARATRCSGSSGSPATSTRPTRQRLATRPTLATPTTSLQSLQRPSGDPWRLRCAVRHPSAAGRRPARSTRVALARRGPLQAKPTPAHTSLVQTQLQLPGGASAQARRSLWASVAAGQGRAKVPPKPLLATSGRARGTHGCMRPREALGRLPMLLSASLWPCRLSGASSSGPSPPGALPARLLAQPRCAASACSLRACAPLRPWRPPSRA